MRSASCEDVPGPAVGAMGRCPLAPGDLAGAAPGVIAG
jgi:hypothetical protein